MKKNKFYFSFQGSALQSGLVHTNHIFIEFCELSCSKTASFFLHDLHATVFVLGSVGSEINSFKFTFLN